MRVFVQQAHEPPLYDTVVGEGHVNEPYLQSASPLPMPLRRRLLGCLLLLLLGFVPCPLVLHVVVFYPLMRDSAVARVICGGIYIVFIYVMFRFLVDEATQSPVGMMLRAEVVTVDDVASLIDQRSADLAPVIRFKVRRASLWGFHEAFRWTIQACGIQTFFHTPRFDETLQSWPRISRLKHHGSRTQGDFFVLPSDYRLRMSRRARASVDPWRKEGGTTITMKTCRPLSTRSCRTSLSLAP